MKHRKPFQKILAWVLLAAVLVSAAGCDKAPRADITEKSNTGRLEDAAVMTLSTNGTAQPAAQENPAPVETEAAAVSVPYSPLYDLLGASTRYEVELTPASDIVKITVAADVYLPDTMQLPTLHVTPRDFTQEEVTKLFNALCADTIMYKAQAQMTKGEVAERIADVESEMQTATDKDRIKKLESNLAYWQAEYEKVLQTSAEGICLRNMAFQDLAAQAGITVSDEDYQTFLTENSVSEDTEQEYGRPYIIQQYILPEKVISYISERATVE